MPISRGMAWHVYPRVSLEQDHDLWFDNHFDKLKRRMIRLNLATTDKTTPDPVKRMVPPAMFPLWGEAWW